MQLSQLHGNLVMLFYDYITEMPFLSLLGTHNLNETAEILIAYSELHYNESNLKLIPEQVAMNLCRNVFDIAHDQDSYDYIIPVSYLSNLDTTPGSNNMAAFLCKKFLKLYPTHTTKKCTVSECDKNEYISLFKRWAKIKNLDHWELNEYSAFNKFINNKEVNNHIVSLHDGDTMMGFTTYEILPGDYAICHFAKADKGYKGVYDGLYFAVGKALHAAGIKHWNFEQDLGIPGLRQSKRKYKPEFFLKKFTVSRKKHLL